MAVLAAGPGGGGTPLSQPLSIQVGQTTSPEGLASQFRRQTKRRHPEPVADVVKELQ